MTEEIIPEEAAKTHLLHEEITADLWEVFSAYQNVAAGQMPFTKFSRTFLMTAAQMAAVLAVDTHMTEESFLAMCGALHRIVNASAPKFT